MGFIRRWRPPSSKPKLGQYWPGIVSQPGSVPCQHCITSRIFSKKPKIPNIVLRYWPNIVSYRKPRKLKGLRVATNNVTVLYQECDPVPAHHKLGTIPCQGWHGMNPTSWQFCLYGTFCATVWTQHRDSFVCTVHSVSRYEPNIVTVLFIQYILYHSMEPTSWQFCLHGAFCATAGTQHTKKFFFLIILIIHFAL